MAKSVLELAVGTGQWNAGLKKAKSALDNFTQSQGGLQQALNKDSASVQKFVQMMGQMDSTAKTAKGQMNDYKNTVETLTLAYNQMSKAQQSTIGQTYLEAIEQQKQKYQEVNKVVQDINNSLKETKTTETSVGSSGNGGGLLGMMSVFGGNILSQGLTKLGSELGDTVQQGIELARASEGVRIAFERLNQPGLLDNLKDATHGTVSELELMKAAVKFDDFKLPVEELGTMLAFAQQKAKETGQSVDYMVDSIVTGLGRKSLMILDNLGLSATEVKEKMAETGDMTKAVGEIIREQMAKAGDYVETAADRAARAAADAQNKMAELGNDALPVAEAWASTWNTMKMGIIDLMNTALGPLARSLKSLQDLWNSDWENDLINNKYNLETHPVNPWSPKKGGVGYKAPGGYVVVTDTNTGAVIGGKHFDNPNDTNAINDWRKTLLKSSGGKGTTKTEITYATDSIAAQEAEVSRLTKLWKEAGDAVRDDYALQLSYAKQQLSEMMGGFNPNNVRPIADMTGRVPTPDFGSDWKKDKDGRWYDATAPVAPDTIQFSDGLQKFMDNFEKQQMKSGNETVKALEKFNGDVSKITGGVGSIVSGLQQMGVEIPSEIQNVLGVLTGMSTIMSGITSILSLILIAENIQTTESTIKSIPMIGWALARGGVVKAAMGYEVPGNHYSGDMVPALLNSGETVLNRAQSGILAAQLEGTGNGFKNGQIVGVIEGERLKLVLNNHFRRIGQGELVTW